MPKGTRPKNTVRVGRDAALARDSAFLNGQPVSDGRARVAVGDRALAKAKADRLAATAPRPARTPAPPATPAQPARRDLLKEGAEAIRNNRERMRDMEKQGLAEGGYVKGKGKSCGHKRK